MDVVLMVVMVWVALDAVIVWALWSWSTRRPLDDGLHAVEASIVAPAWSAADDAAGPLRLRLLGDAPAPVPDTGRPAVPHR